MLALDFLLGLSDFVVLLELALCQELRHAEIQVPVEELKVDVHGVGCTSAEIRLGAYIQPVFDGKVDRLSYVESKVEALMVCRSP